MKRLPSIGSGFGQVFMHGVHNCCECLVVVQLRYALVVFIMEAINKKYFSKRNMDVPPGLHSPGGRALAKCPGGPGFKTRHDHIFQDGLALHQALQATILSRLAPRQ